MAIEPEDKLPECSDLMFEESKHIYTLLGSQLPSVSTIMVPLASSYYKGIDSSVLDAAAKRGTTVHNAIENYVLFGLEDINQEYRGYFDAFKKWWMDVSPEPLGTECKVYHNQYRYAGTADLPVKVNGKRILIDLKTTSSVNKMMTCVQLEAYDRAFESQGYLFDGKAILHLQKNGKYSWMFYPHHDGDSWEVFKSLLVVHNHIQKFRR